MDAESTLRRLAETAMAWYGLLSWRLDDLGFRRSQCEERKLADASAAFCEALEAAEGLDAAGLGDTVLDVVDELRRLRDAFLARWGWQALAGPGRRDWIRERIDQYERPYYSALLSLPRDVRRARGWSGAVDRGRRLGYVADPRLTTEEALRIVEARMPGFLVDPVFGERSPDAFEMHRERDEIRRAAGAVVAGIDEPRRPEDADPPPDDRHWILGGRCELNLAMGKSRGYSKYLERQRDKQVLELRYLTGGLLAIRLVDPARHADVAAKLACLRASRGSSPV